MAAVERFQFEGVVYSLKDAVRGERADGTSFMGKITKIQTVGSDMDEVYVDGKSAGYVPSSSKALPKGSKNIIVINKR